MDVLCPRSEKLYVRILESAMAKRVRLINPISATRKTLLNKRAATNATPRARLPRYPRLTKFESGRDEPHPGTNGAPVLSAE
jgi:hypothetical protein